MRPLASPGIRARRFLLLLWAAVPPVSIFACGSRTALPSPERELSVSVTIDASIDVRAREAGFDALPPIDARVRDASRDNCPDADSTLVYVVTETNEILSFDPPVAAFRSIGQLTCPAPPGFGPFSMAVDRSGVAYVLYANTTRTSGRLFRVSTLSAACTETDFVPSQLGFDTFGMGFSSDQGGPDETLFVASSETAGATRLGLIGLPSFDLSEIGPFDPPIFRAELTGSGDGRLYAFYEGVGRSFIGEIDKTTARVVAEDELLGVSLGNGWAFAYWGGDFYTFTGPSGGGATVTRFRPADKSVTVVGRYSSVIVGAGVSTCAPQQ